jgi:hypothetical protein
MKNYPPGVPRFTLMNRSGGHEPTIRVNLPISARREFVSRAPGATRSSRA